MYTLLATVVYTLHRTRVYTLHPHPHPHPNPNPNPNPSPALSLRQERLRECTRCWLPLDLCLCADGRIQTGETSRV